MIQAWVLKRFNSEGELFLVPKARLRKKVELIFLVSVHSVVKNINEWTMGENVKIALILVHLSQMFCDKFVVISQLHKQR